MNVFVDAASSLNWSESAVDVSTCLAPSHLVYSVMMKRYLLPIEHLSLQGIWRYDAENMQAFDSMADNHRLARDLAGNSFTGTVCQAAFLSCLISCSAWREIGVNSPIKEPSNHESTDEGKDVMSQTVAPNPRKRQKVRDGVCVCIGRGRNMVVLSVDFTTWGDQYWEQRNTFSIWYI